jgi:hypothetical protein
VTVIAGATGTRIDCDRCPRHVGSHFLPAIELRKLTEFVRVGDHDYCPACAARILSLESASA